MNGLQLSMPVDDTLRNGAPDLESDKGDIVGLHDGELVTNGPPVDSVAHDLLARMHADSADLVTLYAGDFVAAAAYPDAELVIERSGQPRYFYIFSVE